VGLSIGYELSLPSSVTQDAIAERLEHVRLDCIPMPGVSVDSALTVGTDWGAAAFPVGRGRVQQMEVIEPEVAVYFTLRPGEGAEPAIFGLARHRPNPRTRGRWFGQWACKTQYAASPKHGGIDHFVRCHLAVIAALDLVKRRRISVKVFDDGGFWKSRRLPRLLAALDAHDRVIARVVGRFKDAFADRGGVVAPITERPDFEHLEAATRPGAPPERWSVDVRALLRWTKGRRS
jgi:hypothetical protein